MAGMMGGGGQVCHHTTWLPALVISHASLMHTQIQYQYKFLFQLWNKIYDKLKILGANIFVDHKLIYILIIIAHVKAASPAKKAVKAARPAKKATKPAKKASKPAKKATKAKKVAKKTAKKWDHCLNYNSPSLVFHKKKSLKILKLRTFLIFDL